MIPLYKEHGIQPGSGPARQGIVNTAHKGLWLERFYHGYDDKFFTEGKSAKAFLQSTFERLGKQCGDSAQLERAFFQRQGLVHACGGASHFMQSDWHFVTGLGSPNPSENALLFHPTLGVPYLPASGVKGLVRSWIERQLDDAGELLYRLFGSEDKRPGSHQPDFVAGEVLFFDALPVKPVTLVMDTMTPHMGNWYAQGGAGTGQHDQLPADWHDPTPVSFLTAKDLLMLFSFAPRVVREDTMQLMDLVGNALQNALGTLGAGAKTAAGYGTFDVPDAANQRFIDGIRQSQASAIEALEEARALAAMSPQQQVLRELEQGAGIRVNQAPSTGAEFHARVLEVLNEAASWPDEEKNALINFAQGFTNDHVSKKKKKDFKKAINNLR